MTTIHDTDSELVVATKLRQSELDSQRKLLERLLTERRHLLGALAPFVDAARELPHDQKYHPRDTSPYSRMEERNRVICAVGSRDLTAKHFATALEIYEAATRPAKEPKAKDSALELPA